jgi:hypothetical protein
LQKGEAAGVPGFIENLQSNKRTFIMELINQHTKKIMEGCKERAQGEGLKFSQETLEYIVTNRDLLELSPKGMIPTLAMSFILSTLMKL